VIAIEKVNWWKQGNGIVTNCGIGCMVGTIDKDVNPGGIDTRACVIILARNIRL
jgi:hypothetical protein